MLKLKMVNMETNNEQIKMKIKIAIFFVFIFVMVTLLFIRKQNIRKTIEIAEQLYCADSTIKSYNLIFKDGVLSKKYHKYRKDSKYSFINEVEFYQYVEKVVNNEIYSGYKSENSMDMYLNFLTSFPNSCRWKKVYYEYLNSLWECNLKKTDLLKNDYFIFCLANGTSSPETNSVVKVQNPILSDYVFEERKKVFREKLESFKLVNKTNEINECSEIMLGSLERFLQTSNDSLLNSNFSDIFGIYISSNYRYPILDSLCTFINSDLIFISTNYSNISLNQFLLNIKGKFNRDYQGKKFINCRYYLIVDEVYYDLVYSQDYSSNYGIGARSKIKFYRTATDVRLIDVISNEYIKKTFYGSTPIAKKYLKDEEVNLNNFFNYDLPKEKDVIEWLNNAYIQIKK